MNEREQAALTLLVNGYDRKTTGLVIGVSESTVSTWFKKYGWGAKIAEQRLFRETSTYKVQQLIQFNLDVHAAIVNLRRDQLAGAGSVDELKKLLSDKGDIDALTKLYSTVKGNELNWEKIVSTVHMLFKFIEEKDLKLAQRLQPLAAQFLEQKRMQTP